MRRSRSGNRDGPTLMAAEREGAIELQVHVGVLVAHAPETDPDPLQSFATQVAEDTVDELASATEVTWRFYLEDAVKLPTTISDGPRSSSITPLTEWSRGRTNWSSSRRI